MNQGRTLLIRGGTVVTPDMMLEADVLVNDEVIQAIGKNLPAPENGEVVEARDLIVLPGVIDAHTHIQLDTGIYQTQDDWLTGSRAAAFGGVTSVIDFATQFKGQTFEQALEARLQEAAPSVIDYAFHMMVTDVAPGQEDELGALPELGIQSIKLYTTYRPNYYADDATILRLLEAAGRYGIISLIHCENDSLVTAQTQSLVEAGQTGWRYHGASRPALAEQEATARILFLAEAANAPVVIAHNSTGLTAALVANARKSGQVAFSETTPQYLLLDESVYQGLGTTDAPDPWRYILQPPLRAAVEREKLWELLGGGWVDMISSDHCDYTAAQKLAGNDNFTRTPGGLPGVETLLPLMATYGVGEGRLHWTDLARMLSANPAHIYNLWPYKGALIPGADADIVLYDPVGESTLDVTALHTQAGYSPYADRRIQGRVVSTLSRGAFLVRDGEFVGEPGRGQYLQREPSFWH